MKKTIQIILLASLNSTLLIAIQPKLTPDNCRIVTDADNVLIEPTLTQKTHLIGSGLSLNPLTSSKWIASLAKIGIKKSLQNKDDSSVNGLTFQFLHYATEDNNLIPHVPHIIKILEHERCYIEGTQYLYHYLKEKKGYTIIIATNKDRPSYDAANEVLNFNVLATQSFVAHPGNSDAVLQRLKTFSEQNTTPENYKHLLDYALTVQPSSTVYHAPSRKPHREYYEYVHQTIGKDKHIIFIDDKKENIDGFNILQESTEAQLHGIHFKHPVQLAHEFVKLGILSEKDDAHLLQEIQKYKHNK